MEYNFNIIGNTLIITEDEDGLIYDICKDDAYAESSKYYEGGCFYEFRMTKCNLHEFYIGVKIDEDIKYGVKWIENNFYLYSENVEKKIDNFKFKNNDIFRLEVMKNLDENIEINFYKNQDILSSVYIHEKITDTIKLFPYIKVDEKDMKLMGVKIGRLFMDKDFHTDDEFIHMEEDL